MDQNIGRHQQEQIGRLDPQRPSFEILGEEGTGDLEPFRSLKLADDDEAADGEEQQHPARGVSQEVERPGQGPTAGRPELECALGQVAGDNHRDGDEAQSVDLRPIGAGRGAPTQRLRQPRCGANQARYSAGH